MSNLPAITYSDATLKAVEKYGKAIETISYMRHQDDWYHEEVAHETERLRAILRNPKATEEERRVALDQLAHWSEKVDLPA